ncbi:MAG: dTDP-4-dehydrorhamnose reductase [Candidatus Omnitrophota bacterium]|nr:MAG: dTDP-4-dehydrorhamnose reductase [Candidatus Omnitrophota bacterium]
MENKKILIAGANGQLAKAFQEILKQRNIPFAAPKEEEFNITDLSVVEQVILEQKPDILINCAAYNAVDAAEDDAETAFAVNTKAVENLASVCKQTNCFFVHYSTDYVFDGTKQGFYTEEDPANPLSVYGKTKLESENLVEEKLSDYLIFRLSWVFGNGKQNFLYKLLSWSKENSILKISADEVSVPTYTEDIVNCTLLSLDKGLKGLYHLTNSGYASRYEYAKYFIHKMDLENIVLPAKMSDFPTKAKRPEFSAMSNHKLAKDLGIVIPEWEQGVEKFVLTTEM